MIFTEGVLEVTALGIHAAFQIKDQQWRRLDDLLFLMCHSSAIWRLLCNLISKKFASLSVCLI